MCVWGGGAAKGHFRHSNDKVRMRRKEGETKDEERQKVGGERIAVLLVK